MASAERVEASVPSEFLSAAQRGSAADTRTLLADESKDPNERDAKGNSALHWAAYFDECGVLRLLLADERVDVFATSLSGATCLHMCAVADACNALTVLLSDEFSTRLRDSSGHSLVNARNQWGETALHLAAAAAKHTCVQLLCESGGALTTVKDNWGNTALRVAKQNGESATFELLRVFCTDDVVTEAETVTADMYYASGVADDSRLKASHSLKSSKLIAEFMKEAASKRKRLESSGAIEEMVKVSHAFEVGGRVLDESEAKEREADICKPKAARKHGLSHRCEYGITLVLLKQLTVDDSIDCDGKDYFGLTALHKAVSWRKPEFVALLLSAMTRTGVCALDTEGESALHMAAAMANAQITKLLLESGKCYDCLSVENKRGLTPLSCLYEAEAKVPLSAPISAKKAIADTRLLLTATR